MGGAWANVWYSEPPETVLQCRAIGGSHAMTVVPQ
jgi:hypothetical protein